MVYSCLTGLMLLGDRGTITLCCRIRYKLYPPCSWGWE